MSDIPADIDPLVALPTEPIVPDPEPEIIDIAKLRTVQAVMGVVQDLAPIIDSIALVLQEYDDVVGEVGLNESEITYLRVLGKDVTDALKLLQDLQGFLRSDTAAATKRRIAINRVRRLSGTI